MPRRKYPHVSGEYYHIYNRGIYRQPIFLSSLDYQKALLTLIYYQFQKVPMKLSYLLAQPKERKNEIFGSLTKMPKQITVIAFCLMPNHFHFLVRQELEKGLSKWMGNFQNSYTKSFNARHKQNNAILNRQFKSVFIETQEQLLHLTRYIHLNPYSAGIISKEQIFTYPWSSAQEYATGHFTYSDPTAILDMNIDKYREFVLNNADYQKHFERIKHLTIEGRK